MRVWIIVAVLALVLLAGCASVPKVKYFRGTKIQLADSTWAERTINDVSISVSPFSVYKEMLNPKYNASISVYYTPYFAPIYENFQRKINFFNGTTPFEVTITNNTDQILKLEESRIMYLDPITDSPVEPYMAISPEAIRLNPSILPVFNELVASFANLKPQSTNHVNQIGMEIARLAGQLKFINTPNREIMPGMKYTGLIMIPIPGNKITEGKLSFIDIVTKSATAGYATEKVRYDFPVRNAFTYWKMDRSLGKNWIEIDKAEYETGNANK